MRLPTSVIWLDQGGYILRYALGVRNGRISPDLGLLPGNADSLDVAIREVEDPDRLFWQESRVQDPGGLFELEEEKR